MASYSHLGVPYSGLLASSGKAERNDLECHHGTFEDLKSH